MLENVVDTFCEKRRTVASVALVARSAQRVSASVSSRLIREFEDDEVALGAKFHAYVVVREQPFAKFKYVLGVHAAIVLHAFAYCGE